MYCPVCGAEYRPGFTECSDCQVALVTEPPRASSEEESAEYASYVTIWSGDDPLKHAQILEALDDAGIPTRSLNREDRSFHLVTMPAFEVFVPEDFVDSAQETLKQIAAIENPDEPGSGIFEIPAEADVPDQDDYDGYDSPSPRGGSTRAGAEMDRAFGTMRGRDRLSDPDEDASTEVWSGQDAATANMIALSLRENEIPFRRDPDPSEAGAAESAARREPPDRDSQTATYEAFAIPPAPAGADLSRDPRDAGRVWPAPPATTIFVYPEDERRALEIIREILNAAPPE